jgi:hypothetical protein
VSVLVGGIPGASSRLSGGLTGVGPEMMSDVAPMAIAQPSSLIGPRAGKFRRSLRGVAKDENQIPLVNSRVDAFRSADDVRVDETITDATGTYEVSLYEDGPFYCDAINTGPPVRVGRTVETLTGV